MTCSRWFRRCAAGMLLGAGLAGCVPGGEGAKDEQHEAHFLRGKMLASQMDYDGAVDAYERALQVNPRSASAHFELALLCEGSTHDPAGAVYHYQRFLKISPSGDSRTDQARDHLNQCMMELARKVPSLVVLPPMAQAELEKLAQENRDLKARLAQMELASAARLAAVPTNPPPPVPALNPPPPSGEVAQAGNSRPSPAPTAVSAGRTYVVKPNDTFVSLARRYGTTVNALQAVNPRVEPRHLQVGSTLYIPAP